MSLHTNKNVAHEQWLCHSHFVLSPDLSAMSPYLSYIDKLCVDKCMSALEQALPNLEARYLETQKQIQLLTDGFQQLQQLLLQ